MLSFFLMSALEILERLQQFQGRVMLFATTKNSGHNIFSSDHFNINQALLLFNLIINFFALMSGQQHGVVLQLQS